MYLSCFTDFGEERGVYILTLCFYSNLDSCHFWQIVVTRQHHLEAAAPELELKIADLELSNGDEALTDVERLEEEKCVICMIYDIRGRDVGSYVTKFSMHVFVVAAWSSS